MNTYVLATIRPEYLTRICGLIIVLGLTGCANYNLGLTVENDGTSLSLPAKGNYTQGFDLGVSANTPFRECYPTDECTPGLGQKIVQALNFLEYTEHQDPTELITSGPSATWVEWGLGQEIFTPVDITQPTIIHNDRPYGGWLYGRLTIRNDRFIANGFSNWRDDQHRSISAYVGVVGPMAQASAVQKWWHEDVCKCTYPAGWHSQIKNEPAINFSFAQEDRIWLRAVNDRWLSDVLTNIELNLGNVHTGLKVGGEARLGYRLPRHFTRYASSAQYTQQSRRDSYFYMFAGWDGQYVLRDIFLDGNSFRTSPHTVDKESFISEEYAGFEWSTGKMQWRFTYVRRSRQFESQPASDRFGSITITYSQ